MRRAEIYDLIERERANQDTLWPRDLGANPKRAQYKYCAPHILLLEEKLARLRRMWYDSEPEKFQAEFVKMATIAVRALEEIEF